MTAEVRRRRLTIVVCLLGLLVAELFMRVTVPATAVPSDWYDDDATRLIMDMDRLALAGETGDLVFVGTSMVRRDVHIPTIERELRSAPAARNAGLNAAQAPVVRRWLLEEVEPRLHPTRIVWGVQSLDFNGNRPDPTNVRYDNSRAVRSGILGAADRALARVSMLSRFREKLRTPKGILQVFRRDQERDLAKLMSPPLTETWTNLTVKELDRIRAGVLSDFAVDQGYADAFAATLRDLQELGIETVVVLMPVPPEYIAQHPAGAADYTAFTDWLAATVAAAGVPLLDYGEAFPTSAFRDYTHLTGDGARDFSRILADDLADIGW